jgi:hypothetical protein
MTKEEAMNKIAEYLPTMHCIQWLDWDISKDERFNAAVEYMGNFLQKAGIVE